MLQTGPAVPCLVLNCMGFCRSIVTFAVVQGKMVIEQLLVAVDGGEQGPHLLVLLGLLLVD